MTLPIDYREFLSTKLTDIAHYSKWDVLSIVREFVDAVEAKLVEAPTGLCHNRQRFEDHMKVHMSEQLYRIRQMKWFNFGGYDVAETCIGCYLVTSEFFQPPQLRENIPCYSIEHGKQLAEQHYRERIEKCLEKVDLLVHGTTLSEAAEKKLKASNQHGKAGNLEDGG